MLELRDYQKECLKAIWDEINQTNRALVVASTGSGKTVVFVKLVERAVNLMKGKSFRAMILVHKIDLVTQTQDKFNQFAQEIETGIFCGSLNKRDKSSQVVIASIDSIRKEDLEKFNLVIVDEVHSMFKRNTFNEFMETLRAKNKKLKEVYFTATPYKGSRGYIYGERPEHIVEKPCYQIGMTKLQDRGYLCDLKFKAPRGEFDLKDYKISSNGDYSKNDLKMIVRTQEDKVRVQVENAILHLTNAKRKKVIWACTSIEHAEMVERELFNMSERAVCVHSKKNIKRQIELMEAFEHGEISHMVSVTKLSEGTDIPCVDAIVCMRPTRSPILYVQLAGRALRPYKSKEYALFLDYGGVVAALGHPKKPLILKEKERSNGNPKSIICPACREINFAPIDDCVSCGYEFLEDEREVDRLKNLGLVPYDPSDEGKIRVISWNIHWHYKSKAGRDMVLISYTTLNGVKREYIPNSHSNYYYRNFVIDHEKGPPRYIKMDDKNRFVKKRIYE